MRAAMIAMGTCLLMIAFAPAAAASELPTGTRVEGDCVVVYDFPDAGYALCKSSSEDCTISERRTTFTGTEERCLA